MDSSFPVPDAQPLRAPPGRADLRMPALGVAAWVGSLCGGAAGSVAALLGAAAGAVLVLLALRSRVPGRRRLAAGCALVLLGCLATSMLRGAAVTTTPVTQLAEERAVVAVVVRVTSDPRLVRGRFGDQAAVRMRLLEVTGRGARHRLDVPVLLLGDDAWHRVPLGATISARARLGPADGRDLAALLLAPGDPRLVSAPGPGWRGAERLRASIREAVAPRPDPQRALVPALVDGDDAGLDPAVVEQFRVTGLTHLTAVSGTNLTLVVGFLLALARWVGVRGRWLTVVGAAGVVGFVLLARTEPSVLRAAVMGSVGLVAMGLQGRDRALRALGVALIVLLLLQPALAASAGFVLSVLATAGIVLIGPGLRDAMAAWLPRAVAEAVAVPMAAQLACTPVVAAISGQVSLVAVGANLLVGPVVGPATVLGLAGGLVGLVSGPASHLPGTAATWCVGWIVLVARRGADLPLPAIDWDTSAVALAGLTVATLAVALAAPTVLRRPALSVGLVLLLVVALTRPPGRLLTDVGGSWPPARWVMVACDVGQGDALVLRAGPRAAVVVDTGPDPDPVDRCLRRLGVDRVPVVVLTHFHADHVGGLAGVLAGRSVGPVLGSRVLDPPGGVAQVRADLADADDRRAVTGLGVAPWGRTFRVGRIRLQVLWPAGGPRAEGAGDGSSANDASVVLLAAVDGVRLLLTGDIEPAAQARLAAELGPTALDVDVVKVPHHGSRYQDLDWLASLRAEQALISVGEDNDYGHPAPATVDALERSGAHVHRTDRDGDLAVVVAADAGVRTVAR